jgi:hypothetical protein
VSWLIRIIASSLELRFRARGTGFPGAPDSIRSRTGKAPLRDPVKFRKTYRGN